MSQGPSLLFDKSTLESLSLNEAALLDNFYRCTITPLFFVECLADLERKMVRMKGRPEQLVGSLAERTPDLQSMMNMHHMQILVGELSGQFTLDSVLLRPVVASGKVVELGDSKGMVFQASDEEEAMQRWARYDFLGLERQIAKRWRKMIEEIDLQSMSTTVLKAIGPWRKPTSLQDARSLTDNIIDNLDQEWLLHFGLALLGVPEATQPVVNQWRADRKRPLRSYRPYFVHMLSINIFFSLVLPTQLLRNVKASHQIDLAYLYYLPFCAVFSSRDDFHVQVAPLFMHPAQQFVHGDDLKADLKKLDELYRQLPKETLEKGFYSFAPSPPDDSSYLITRLWDAYLPRWRKASKNAVEVPEKIKEALKDLIDKHQKAVPAAHQTVVNTDQLAFAEMSRQIKPKKGDYFRIGKDVVLKNHQEELKRNVKTYPPGTQFAHLLEQLASLLQDEKCANIEVAFISYKLDDQGNKVLDDNMHLAEIRPIAVYGLTERTRQSLRLEYERFPLLSLLVLWTRYGAGKLGIMKFHALAENEPLPSDVGFEKWEAKAICSYLDRHSL